MACVESFLRQILDQPPWLIYAVTFAVVFLEDAIFIGFVFPGETVAILGGVSASLGHTEVGWMAFGVIAAAIVGDSVGYEVGKVFGDQVLRIPLLRKRTRQLHSAQNLLGRRGGLAVLLGRWTAFFRAVMPALAGWSQMPYRVFLPWNAIGGIIWGLVVVLGGYFAGMSYKKVAAWLGGGSATLVALAVITSLVVWHVRRRAREAQAEDASGAEGAPAI